ncbi:hypothetical protein SUGI_0838600 [Cryptomeria japonica]|uniref:uncharacterized protein LOC131079469 isoform X2 n=1 Tax=Cryptomeria japonica TaxID=3369 RepID=UPI0024148D2D|nr:uncharacterized protein LOC131079469 isoform X2 [Cryptomeria japonica]GLJ40626.1 hypothetical protein SUGI_0838600 [Cryptomeria japonica]
MGNKRQRLARQKFIESHPNPNPPPPAGDENTKKKKKRKREGGGGKAGEKGFKRARTKTLGKHPLRVPGMKPGDGCFFCHSKDHIAKYCPQKAQADNKKICLLCRERGHTLKHCPNSQESQETAYCYNCGETGHRLSKCPEPIKNGGTAFAECFLCKERGHLSKNCPTNSHGIYPKGGSCKVCGGLTHLAKDCPEKLKRNIASGQGRTRLQISKEPAVAAKPGEQGQRIVFRSGDDLEDDFALEDNNIKASANGHSFDYSKVDELSSKVEMEPLKLKGTEKKHLMGQTCKVLAIIFKWNFFACKVLAIIFKID